MTNSPDDELGISFVRFKVNSLGLRRDLVFHAASVQGKSGNWAVSSAVTGHGWAAIAWYRSDEEHDAKLRRAYMNAVRLGLRQVPGRSSVGLATDSFELADDVNSIIGAVNAGRTPPLTGDGYDQVVELIRQINASVIPIPERKKYSLGSHPGIRQARALAMVARLLISDGQDPRQQRGLLSSAAQPIKSTVRVHHLYQNWQTQRTVQPNKVGQRDEALIDPEMVTTVRLRLPLDGKPTMIGCGVSTKVPAGSIGGVGACAAVSGDGVAALSWWRPHIGDSRTRMWAVRLGLNLAGETKASALLVGNDSAPIIAELKAIRSYGSNHLCQLNEPCDPDVVDDIADLLAAQHLAIHAFGSLASPMTLTPYQRVAYGLSWAARRLIADGHDPHAHKDAIAQIALARLKGRDEMVKAYCETLQAC